MKAHDMSENAMQVLSHAEYGVYLLTVADGEKINGMPLSLFSQVSFKPPQVICGVSEKRLSHSMIEKAGSFAVIFLRKDQQELVDKFKVKGEDTTAKFEGLARHKGKNGSPILDDCLGYLECRLVETYRPGDHSLFVGEVSEAALVKPGELLVISDLGKYYGGA